ncbi:patatin-like phospholipase family protein [Terricaulis sp.]|uniref:patatin-like phospholipase family protein n=1 Tax=Terricaulis sp. TaxID=2768686 RepID=UPI00378448E1
MADTMTMPPDAKARMRRDAAAKVETKTINLALQGGGAHGAFAWGVLDRLLEDERVAVEGISATSAGAMNAVTLAYGMTLGGREGAKKALMQFWRRVAHAGMISPLQPTWFERAQHNHSLESSPAFVFFDLITRLSSPYQFNPLNYNPLRQVLEQSVDFEMLREKSALKLFLSATNVRSGKVKIFGNDEISADAVMASACLPFMFQAVTIKGEDYWDGGYMGNPAIFPLIYKCESRDIVVVHINPIERNETPTTARDILNRINEISFNSSLMREMRAIAFVSKMIDDGTIDDGKMKRMLIHAVEGQDFMRELGVSSKMNADWEFLTHLRDVGRERAEAWLEANFDALNKNGTVDLTSMYL